MSRGQKYPGGRDYLRGYILKKKYILLFSVLCLLKTTFSILEPYFAKILIDEALYGQAKNFGILLKISIYWALVFIARKAIQFIYRKQSFAYRNRVTKSIILDTFSNVIAFPMSFFQDHSPSYIVSRQFDDAFGVEGLLVNNLFEGLISFIEFVVISAVLFCYSPTFMVVSILLVLLDVVVTFSFPLSSLYRRHNETLAQVKKELVNTYQGVKLIKSANRYDYEAERTGKYIDSYFQALKKRDDANIVRTFVSRTLSDLGAPILVIIGSFMVYKNILTPGIIASSLIYFSKLWAASGPAVNLIPLGKISMTAATRLSEINTVPKEARPLATKAGETVSGIRCIEFRNVSFSYGVTEILRNISFSVSHGQFIAFVGLSGAGKSTIANLILKFLSPSAGDILIDGKYIKDIDTHSLRKQIGYVDQQTILFNRTLRENLLYSCGGSDDKMNYYLSAFNLNDLILTLPKGLDTLLNENTSNLSGGEKQRLCIIRELCKQSDVLILDEYTSSLDALTEKAIHDELLVLAKDKIVILVAHKLNIVQQADRIFVLEQGRIAEEGAHQELLAAGGSYAQLYSQQIVKEGFQQ